MTTSRILPPIHIHPILIIFIIISFVTGTFLQLFIILSIVLFHELGHYGAGKFFKWRIKGIMLWIFVGVMDREEHGNRPFHGDIIVIVAGKFFKWRIKVIMLLIFVGVMDTDEHVNMPFHEDIIVTVAGPLQHLFIYLFLFIDSLGQIQLISTPIWDMIFLYNTLILLFN